MTLAGMSWYEVRTLVAARITVRAQAWALANGTFWGLFSLIAATDPNAQVSRAWRPVRELTGSTTPWVVVWGLIFAAGVAAVATRRYVFYVATLVAAGGMSIVWVSSILAARFVDGAPISFGAVVLWAWLGVVIVFGHRISHPLDKDEMMAEAIEGAARDDPGDDHDG